MSQWGSDAYYVDFVGCILCAGVAAFALCVYIYQALHARSSAR
jgi:hypothetical protein